MESPGIRPTVESPKNSFYDYQSNINSGQVPSGKAKTQAGQKDPSISTFRTTRIPVSTYRGGKSSFPLQFSSVDSGIATTSNLNGSTDQSQSINQHKMTSGNKIGSRLIHIGCLKPSQIPLRKYGTRTIISDTKSEDHIKKPSANKNVHTVPLIYKPDLNTEVPITPEKVTRLEVSPTTSTLRPSSELFNEDVVNETPLDTQVSYSSSQSTRYSLDSDDTSGRDICHDHMTGFPRVEKVTAVYDSIIVATNKIKAVNECVSRWLNNEFKIPLERPPKTLSMCRYCSMTEDSGISDKNPVYCMQDKLNLCMKNDPNYDSWMDFQKEKDTKSVKIGNSKVKPLKYRTANATYVALETQGFKCKESLAGVNRDSQYPSDSTMRTPEGGIPVPSYTVCPSEVIQKTTNFECFDSVTNSMTTDLDVCCNVSSQFTMEHPNEYAILDAWCTPSCHSQNVVNHTKCTGCSPGKVSWALRENQDGFSDGTNKDSGPPPNFNNQQIYHNKGNKNIYGQNNNNNSAKSLLPSKKYKASRQLKTNRSRYHQLRRWIHVWKKKTKLHTLARSPFKFKKFRMLHHLQQAIIWEDVDVQTNIVVFREIGTGGMAMWQLKSAGVTTSANFSFLKNSCDIKKCEVQERDRSSFKHINVGPSRFPFIGNSHVSSIRLSKKYTQESIKRRKEIISEPSKTFGFFSNQPKPSIKCYVHNHGVAETILHESLNPLEFKPKIKDKATCTVAETKLNELLSPIEFKPKIVMDNAMCTVTEAKLNESLSPIEFKPKIMDSATCTVTEPKLNESLSPIEFKPKIMDSATCTVTEPKLNESLSPIEIKPKIMDSATCTVTEIKLNQLLSPIELKTKIMDSATCTDTQIYYVTNPIDILRNDVPRKYYERKINQTLSPAGFVMDVEDCVIHTKTIRPKKEISVTEVSQKSDNMKHCQKGFQNTFTEPIQQIVEETNTQTVHLGKSIGVSKREKTDEDETQMTPAPTHDHLTLLKSFGTQQSYDRMKSYVADKELETESHIQPMSMTRYTILVNGSHDYQRTTDIDQEAPTIIWPYALESVCRCTKRKSNKQTMKTSQLDKPKASDNKLSVYAQCSDEKCTNDIGTDSQANSQLKIICSEDHHPAADEISLSCQPCVKKSIDIGIQPKTTSHYTLVADPSRESRLSAENDRDIQDCKGSRNSKKLPQESKNKIIDVSQSRHKQSTHKIETLQNIEPTPMEDVKQTAYCKTDTNLSYKMHPTHLHPSHARKRTSQSTLVENIYKPFIYESGTTSPYSKPVGMSITKCDKSMMHLNTTVTASTNTELLSNTKSTGSSAVDLKNLALDAYAQYSTYRCGKQTNAKEVQTDRELKSAAVLTSSVQVDKATEPQFDDTMLRESNQFGEPLTALVGQCNQSIYFPLAQKQSTTGMVLEEDNLGNLTRLIAKTRGNQRKKLVASAPTLYEFDNVEYSNWTQDYRHKVPVINSEGKESKLTKLISRTSRKSKSPFVRADPSILRHDTPKPFEKLSKDSLGVFPKEIPEYDLYPNKLAAGSDEIAVFEMPDMIDKDTSNMESKDLKESIIKKSPEFRDAGTESQICNRRSAGILTSQSLMPKPMFCYPYPEINPLADYVFVYDPPCDVNSPSFQAVQSSYQTLLNTTKLVKSMNVMTDGGAEAFGFISTGTSTCAPGLLATPFPAEVIRTCSKNYHARVLRLPSLYNQGLDEEQMKEKPVFGSCRYYNNLLTKQLVRMKENLKNLKNAEDCPLYQRIPSMECKPDCTACTMIPSGRVELCCQTTKLSKIGTPLSRCVMAPSVTNIGDGQDKKHLQSIYYMLTAIEGRIRRLKQYA